MSRPLVKICGLTTIADLRLALALGADYVGMIIDIPRSPRNLSLQAARYLRRHAQKKAVIVTEDLKSERLTALAEALQPAALQLHGREHPQFIASLCRKLPAGVAVWKALGVPPLAADPQAAAADLLRDVRAYRDAGCAMIVLDTATKSGVGGTGQPSDWSLAAKVVAASPLPVMLAGGIGADNLMEAWRVVRPAGFDVSSRVEESPGKKSASRLARLFEAVALLKGEGEQAGPGDSACR